MKKLFLQTAPHNISVIFPNIINLNIFKIWDQHILLNLTCKLWIFQHCASCLYLLRMNTHSNLYQEVGAHIDIQQNNKKRCGGVKCAVPGMEKHNQSPHGLPKEIMYKNDWPNYMFGKSLNESLNHAKLCNWHENAA